MTVLARFGPQAMWQVLQAKWDASCADHRDGVRPHRSAHQAVEQAQPSIAEGSRGVVELALEKCFDRVHHEKVRGTRAKRLQDKRVLKRLRGFLQAGVLEGGLLSPTAEGTPQGGPQSPLLANLVLDELEKELERRGHRYARYADASNIYVRSLRAGERVMASVRRFLERKLRLKVNEAKSAVDRPWNRTFLGFTFTRRQSNRRKVSEKALKAFRAKVRELTGRTRGRTIRQIVQELRQLILGWRAFFGFAEVRSPLRDLDKWIRRRLRK